MFKLTKGKKKGIALLAGAALLAVGVGSCMMGANQPEMLQVSGASMQAIESFLSTTGTIQQGNLEEHIVAASTEVGDVYYEVGDQVKKGM